MGQVPFEMVQGAKRRAQSVVGENAAFRTLRTVFCGLLLSSMFTGCAAMTNPAANGIPVRHLPTELLVPSKETEQTIPLNLLRQPANKTYKLGAGDVLGVYIDGFLGERNVPVPVHVSPPVYIREQRRQLPSFGYPVMVQPDGTIALPSVPPLAITGMTLNEAREAIRKHYVDRQILRPENDRISVTLMQGRQHEIMVLRQEAQGFGIGPEGVIGTTKRGTGYVVQLPAYENDVLRALTLSGGLPGLDAYNEIVIYRDSFRDGPERAAMQKRLEALPADRDPLRSMGLGGHVTRIPLRLPPCAELPFGLEDIVLQSGDVVYLEAREDQWYYTGGLLPSAKHLLPRDRDLDVIQAITEVHGPLDNGAFGANTLAGTLIAPGLGSPSPALLSVIRRMPGGGQVNIKVDLRRALNDPRERILLQAGDVLILQETPAQAMTRYFSQTFLNFNVFWKVFQGNGATGVLDISAPDRLPQRVGILNGAP